MANSVHSYDLNSKLSDNKFTLNGWTFKGWNTKADGTGTDYNNGEVISDLTSKQNGVITLYAQWEIDEFDIVYIVGEGYNPNTVTKFTVDDVITLQAPILPGYNGTWSISVIPIGTFNKVETTASYTPRNFYVDCHMNDGTGVYNRLELKRGESTALEPAVRSGYYFGGWTYNGEYITRIDDIQTDMDLYAVWIPKNGQIYELSSSASVLTVSDEISIIELPNTLLSNSPKIIVSANVRKLIIHSNVYMNYNFYIEIDSRSQDIDIVLLNFNLHAPYWRSAIGPSGSSNIDQIYDLTFNLNINLYAYNCFIDTQIGIPAIICSNITIHTPITIEGGSGGRYSGCSSSAIYASSVTINSTYVSLYGGNGYESGGADAVNCPVYYTKDVYRETVQLVAGEDDKG